MILNPLPDVATLSVSELGRNLYWCKVHLGGTTLTGEQREILEDQLVALDSELRRRGIIA